MVGLSETDTISELSWDVKWQPHLLFANVCIMEGKLKGEVNYPVHSFGNKL